MRQFNSYGPVNCKYHFCVARRALVDKCCEQLIGVPDEGGYYFTIWGARQTGKTWLMEQVRREIPRRYADKFAVFNFSLGSLRELPASSDENANKLPEAFVEFLRVTLPSKRRNVRSWTDFYELFTKDNGLWDQPLILLIDEVDTFPPDLLDLMIAQFRELYLHRERNWLHGLALVGVRAVLGVGSRRGSPFNIQRSLHVPNLTPEEVAELYRQYQEESGQKITAAVVDQVYQVTRGQPGLVSWFGELLTDKYNPGRARVIDRDTWELVWHKARFVEPNNTVMNLIAKARMAEYQGFLVKLFSREHLPFAFHNPVHNYLYTHGIIEPETVCQSSGALAEICRFSSPFVQDCLYTALSDELVGDSLAILVLDPLDNLADVFAETSLNLPALLRRYKDYLARLQVQGLNPWKEQPRRTDLHLTEAVGHFHLYAWLKEAVGRRCVVSPEFPTGNGKVDLHLRCGERRGVIEVKSFVDAYRAREARGQAARYAASLGLDAVTVAMFVPVSDDATLAQLSVEEAIEGVRVSVVAIGNYSEERG